MIDDGAVHITWKHSATDFTVACEKVRPASEGWGMRDTKATFLDLVLAPGTYVFRVRAENHSGYSAWSEASAEHLIGSEAEAKSQPEEEAEAEATSPTEVEGRHEEG